MKLNEATSRVFDLLMRDQDLNQMLDEVCAQERPMVVLADQLSSMLASWGWMDIMDRSIPLWDEVPVCLHEIIIDCIDLEAIVTLRIHDLRGYESTLQDPVY
jgi:hypothetical protein